MSIDTEVRVGRLALIQRLVAEQCGQRVADFIGPRRARAISRPRMMAMSLCRDLLGEYSFPLIGRAFGNRDHTTVMHAVARIAEIRQADPAFDRLYLRLQAMASRMLEKSESMSEIEMQADRFADMVAEEVRTRILSGVLEDPKAFVDALLGAKQRAMCKMHPNDVRLIIGKSAAPHMRPALPPMPKRVPTDLRTLGAIRSDLKVTAAKLRAHAAAKDGSAR
jgi:hypothetical protein